MPEPLQLTRRGVLALAGAALSPALPAQSVPDRAAPNWAAIVKHNDEAVATYLDKQITDPANPWRGTLPDVYELNNPGSASGIFVRLMAAYLHAQSRYHRDAELVTRMKLACGHLRRLQTPDGNIDLLITNFNSPPDTSFVVLNAALGAKLARDNGERELFAAIEPYLRRSGEALLRGGVHTPNHRWVACAALAQLYELFENDAFVRRIDQWLAEGVDINADGQYSEQSTTVYNPITDNALTTTAQILKRPELLDPVRRNLAAMQYLLHADGEVVTEISHRQDQNTRGTMSRYWYALRYLALHDEDGRLASLLDKIEPESAGLAELMAYPELARPLPARAPLPDNYEKVFSEAQIARIRRGETSATVLLRGSSRLLAARHGEAVVEGVRMAAAFFGKGQFVPAAWEKSGGKYVLTQSLDAGYYQPMDPPRKVDWGVPNWYAVREERKRTEICKIDYRAEISEQKSGFAVRIVATGTDRVPVAIEINLRPGGKLEGCSPAPGADDAFLPDQKEVVYRFGKNAVRIGPTIRENAYTQVRGAEPKLPGPSLYLTGMTPFDHAVELRWV
jgi:hypothetical protein